jgi:hypothetical protein
VETQIWIIGQIFVDVVLVVLLLWFVKFNDKRTIPWQDFETVFQKSESILYEMREISLALEKNLEEKKALSRHILEQLEEGMKRAEESYRQICNIVRKSGAAVSEGSLSSKGTSQMRSSINALSAKGLSKEEIAQHLGISVGEIELLIKLQRERDSSNG